MFLHINRFWILAIIDFSEVGTLIPENKPVKSLKLFPSDGFARSAGISSDILEMGFFVIVKNKLSHIEIQV